MSDYDPNRDEVRLKVWTEAYDRGQGNGYTVGFQKGRIKGWCEAAYYIVSIPLLVWIIHYIFN